MSAAIFISPHLDDAVLSCGGGIARLTGLDERVTVVTVFTGDQSPGEPLSKLAVRSHASWAAGDQPFAARRAEDLEALGRLGATAEHLGLLDAIYRRSAAGHPLYADSLGTPTADDLEYFLPELVMALRNSAAGTGAAVAADAPGAPGTRHMATRVFCPAGTGGHVDHILTRVAVERVAEPESIVYFDEYPYVTRDGVSQSGGAQAGPDSWPTRTLPLSAEELEARIDRVDELPDGRQVILDYKATAPSVSSRPKSTRPCFSSSATAPTASS